MIQVSDLEDELDRSFVIRSSKLIVAHIDGSLEEEDKMPLDNRKKGLHELFKAKGSMPKDASGSQPPLHHPPLPYPSVDPFAPANLKKRKKKKKMANEGELVP